MGEEEVESPFPCKLIKRPAGNRSQCEKPLFLFSHWDPSSVQTVPAVSPGNSLQTEMQPLLVT